MGISILENSMTKELMKHEIIYKRVEELIPYARNARTHSDGQTTQIAASIREFGFNAPVLIDGQGGIIAGHGRVMAARKLGLESVPTIALPHLSDVQKRAYILADNKLALNSGWDNEMLQLELEEIAAGGLDISLVGFSDEEFEGLLAGDDAVGDVAGDVDSGIDYKQAFSIIVVCNGEQDQKEKYDNLLSLGYECKVLVN